MIPLPGFSLSGLAGARPLVSGPAPTPAPSPSQLKVIFEGDSIAASSSSPVSAANQWIAANPSIETANLAAPGAQIIGGTNTVTHRIPDVGAEAAGFNAVLVVHIGANDLYYTADYPTVGDWQDDLLNYVTAVRAAVPGITVGVATLLPIDEAQWPARAGHNARRALVNPWIRSQVGVTIDFLIPYGEHPEMTDAAAASALFVDGLHPAAGGADYMLETLSAVLGPIVAGATGSVPDAFAFSDNATATASTVYTERNIVTDMGMGESATASVTGGDFAVGTLPGGLSYGTSSAAVMNGDIITSRLTSDADALDTVTHVLDIGGVSDTWSITTAANPATTIFTASYKHASATIQTDRQCYGDDAVNAPQCVFADTAKTSGKWYFEMTFYTPPVAGGASIYQVAVGGPSNAINARPGQTNTAGNAGATYRNSGIVYHSGTNMSGLVTFGISDTIGVCLDAGNDKVWFLKNGVSINGDPVAGMGGFMLNPAAIPDWRPAAVPQREDGHRLNCGQDPFNHAPPEGFHAYG